MWSPSVAMRSRKDWSDLQALVDRLSSYYRRSRGIESGLDPALESRDLVSYVSVELLSRMNGMVRLWPTSFIGRRVRVATDAR